MLTVEENSLLSSIDRGTPMGELLRRYWHPIAAAVQLDERPTLAVKLLGEELVLYRDRSGTLGLIDRLCPHRRVDLSYGIPEEHGLRCMYHGWMFDETGQCIEQPFEETVHPDGRFKEKVRVTGYPVEVLGGLVFAYLGPQPAPLLPRWDLFVEPDAIRQVGFSIIPCNWLQIVENALDPVHVEYLHGWYGKYILDQQAEPDPALLSASESFTKRHLEIAFDVFEHGIVKRRLVEGGSRDDEDWVVGHPLVFPCMLRVGAAGRNTFQIRTPLDDHTTLQMYYTAFFAPPGATVPQQDSVPYYWQPVYDENGEYNLESANNQDIMAWVGQGAIADRPHEHLGVTDKGVILLRKLLKEQAQVVADGGDPMNIVRDPAKNEYITLPQEQNKYSRGAIRTDTFAGSAARYGPAGDLVAQMYASV
ncbi:MAG: aromatic ring-hydroxylating dioxygenase subunit alpha [Chloroflexi bacterium]|nr:aromatic ring-hydroxylating dioxygenase subunit alpha [Chloroflexota bacterium]